MFFSSELKSIQCFSCDKSGRFPVSGVLANYAWIATEIRDGVLFVTMKNECIWVFHNLKEETINDQ